ncbi:MAG: hypothetical protein H0T51_22915 [Pirellulales bacterium]|nr:hypothetical protein [Pirellulales bacterium]
MERLKSGERIRTVAQALGLSPESVCAIGYPPCRKTVVVHRGRGQSPNYLPSLEEIKQGCERIGRGWTADERLFRRQQLQEAVA